LLVHGSGPSTKKIEVLGAFFSRQLGERNLYHKGTPRAFALRHISLVLRTLKGTQFSPPLWGIKAGELLNSALFASLLDRNYKEDA